MEPLTKVLLKSFFCTYAYMNGGFGLKMNNNRVLITIRKAVAAQTIAPYFLRKSRFFGIGKS